MLHTKTQKNKFLKKVYKFLNEEHDIQVRPLKGELRGWIHIEKHPTLIRLDVESPVTTLIHELLHYYYPTASEKWVLKQESRIFRSLTPRQHKNLLHRIAQYM